MAYRYLYSAIEKEGELNKCTNQKESGIREIKIMKYMHLQHAFDHGLYLFSLLKTTAICVILVLYISSVFLLLFLFYGVVGPRVVKGKYLCSPRPFPQKSLANKEY